MTKEGLFEKRLYPFKRLDSKYLITLESVEEMIGDARKEFPANTMRDKGMLPHFPKEVVSNPKFREEANKWFLKWFGEP